MKPSGPVEEVVSAGEIAGLAQHFRTAIPASSPLADVGSRQADLAAVQRLKKRGLLDAEWAGAVTRLLAAERPNVAVARVTLDVMSASYAFMGPDIARDARGLLVAATGTDDRYRLRYPLGLPDLMQELMEPLDPVGAAPPEAFDRELSRGGLTALATSIDYLRTLFAASLLGQRGLDLIGMGMTELMTQARDSLAGSDHRSLLRLLSSFLPDRLPAPPDELARGLSELKAAGLLLEIKGESEALAPHHYLLSMAHSLLTPTPALLLLNGAAQSWLISIRGASLWQLEPAANDRFRLRGVDGLVALKSALDFLHRAAGTPASTRKPVETQLVPCTACASPVSVDAKFCPKCGLKRGAKSEKAPALACHKCGNELRAGAKFCPACGESRLALRAEPVLVSCHVCGHENSAGAKFCPKCGERQKTGTAPVSPAAR